VREFSEQAQFKNPSRSVVLRDVFCNSALCSASRDVDLSRERDFVEGDLRCEVCQEAYNREHIEERLVQVLHQVVLAFHQQDLRCNKCRRAAAGLLNPYCACSGTFLPGTTAAEVAARLDALAGVAAYYSFAWLQEEIRLYAPADEEEGAPAPSAREAVAT
jgi:DNA polymerase epsilon subunit 1